MAMNKRTPNFSIKEKHLLIELVEKYKEILENKGSSTRILNQKTETWNKLTEEFNSESETVRTSKCLRLLYMNLKRKTRKDVAEEHKLQYSKAKVIEDQDKVELNKTGGGSYKPQLDDMGAQILGIVGDQMEPRVNEFDDASNYFTNIPLPDPVHPAPLPDLVPLPDSVRQPIPKKCVKVVKKINYKGLYFKKKYELACFELKSKKILHNLDVKIKKKQLENLNSIQ